MPSLYRVTLGARVDRGIPEQIEFWSDLDALENRLSRPRALRRSIEIERWAWTSEAAPAATRQLQLAA